MTKLNFISLFIALVMLNSCTNKEQTNDANAAIDTYAYNLEKPNNWEISDNTNTKNVLSALKAWETGQMSEAVKYFADTIHVKFDGMDQMMPNDSLKVFFEQIWNDSFLINMKEWNSAVSKDKGTEKVTLTYGESWKNETGGKDSVDVINNFVVKDGKITTFDNYIRKIK